MDILTLSIGIGLIVTLLLTEVFGIASSGLIVPGYIALYIAQPLQLASTFAVAFTTWAIIKLVSPYVILFGRRRTAVTILLGYIIGITVNRWLASTAIEASTIGMIIPGLLATLMDRQRSVPTLTSIAISAAIVRLILILLVGTEVLSTVDLGL